MTLKTYCFKINEIHYYELNSKGLLLMCYNIDPQESVSYIGGVLDINFPIFKFYIYSYVSPPLYGEVLTAVTLHNIKYGSTITIDNMETV